MVKSFAHKIDGDWLQSPSASSTRNATHSFNGEADPLYQRAVAASHKTEAEHRLEHSNGEDEDDGAKPAQKRELSKPTPVLKPRSQQGRCHNETSQWLSTQYQAALSNTKPRPALKAVPDNMQQIQRGQSPSR